MAGVIPNPQLRAWSDDTQSTLITPSPVNVVHSIARDMQLNSPYQYTIELELADQLAVNLARDTYIELTVGSSNTLWCSGYVQQTDKQYTDQTTYNVTVNSPLLALANTNCLGMYVNLPTEGFHTVMDVLNGLHAPGQPAAPHEKGMLDFSNWSAVWVTGPGWPQQPVDNGGRGRGDWQTGLANVTSLANIHALYFRERWGSKATGGIIEFGPLSDPSGLTIWGGDQLATKLGLPSGQLPTGDQVMAAGLVDIASATYQDHGGSTKNIIWPLGQGSGPNLITLRSIFGDVFNSDGTLAAGVQQWQPNPNHSGQMYYVKANNVQTWRGHTYELIAAQQQNGEFAYGVVDRTSAAKYGPIELHHHFQKVATPELALALGLGTLEKASNPPPEWTFACRHPFATRAVPKQVFPGQTINVNFSGWVHKANTYNPATGQWEPSGDYQYMTYPNETDPQALINLKRIVQVTDTWDVNGYQATYTMGSTKKKPKMQTMLLSLARQFEENSHASPHHHRWKQEKLAGIEFVATKNPQAWVQESTDEVWLRPGSMFVADVPSYKWLKNHVQVEFTAQLTDNNACLDFVFAHPLGGALKKTDVTGAQGVPDITGTPQYGIVRLCTSGYTGQYNKCGVYTTSDGLTYNHRGVEPHKAIFDTNGRLPPGEYRVGVSLSNNIVEVHLQQISLTTGDYAGTADLAMMWHDHDKALNMQGTIGWYYQVTASQSGILSEVNIKGHHRNTTAGVGGDRGTHTIVGHGSSRAALNIRHHEPGGFVAPVTHAFQKDGSHGHKGEHRHGPFHPTQVGCANVTVDGSDPTLLDVNFSSPLPKGSMKGGFTVYDPAGDHVLVAGILKNANGQQIGFTTRDAAAKNFTGQGIFWDPLDTNQPIIHGHRRTGIYLEQHGGWCIMDVPADGDESKALVLAPDGSTFTLGGQKLLTQPNGDVVSISEITVGAQHFAKGVERDGAALFDAGEVESPTQTVDLFVASTRYPNSYSPSSVINGDPTGFTDLTQTNASAAALWVNQAIDGTGGEADAILMLNTGQYTPPGGAQHTFNAVRWYDTSIVQEDGTYRQYTVRHNSSFTFPLYYAVGSGASGMHLGADATIKSITGSTVYFNRPVATPGPNNPTNAIQTSVGDTWAVGVALPTVDVATVGSVDSTNNAVTFTGLSHTHQPGELMMLKTTKDVNPASPTYNAQVTVQSGMALDGSLNSDHVISAIDVVCIGFYTIDKATNQRSWFRAYWGAPEWICPWASAPGEPGISGLSAGGSLSIGHGFQYAVTFVTATGETTMGTASIVANTYNAGGTNYQTVGLQYIPLGPTGTTQRKVYRSMDGGAWGLVQTINDNTTTSWIDTGATAGVAPPTADTAGIGTANPGYCGPLPANPGTGLWVELLAKAAQCTSFGQPLWAKGTSGQQKIVGVEVAIWSASPGVTGQTAYFDAHQHGVVTTPGKTTAGSTTSGTVAPGTVKTKHKNPSHNADAHVHSDFTFWIDSGNNVHWETGELDIHDGTYFTINGGTEDAPNVGFSAAAGDWLLFNSKSSQVKLQDGANTVILPAYSAAGGSGGQSTGFGAVSSAYNFKARVGGGAIKRGLPDGVFKVGKIGRTPDVYTGELPVHGHHGSGKKHGKQQRKGSISRKAAHAHMQHRLHFVNAVFSMRNVSDLYMVPHNNTKPVAQWDDTGSYQFNITAATALLTAIAAGSIVLFDLSTHAWSAVAPTVNIATDAYVNKVKVGHLSLEPDPYTGNYVFHMYHPGSHENAATNHALKSHLRQHDHKHKQHRGHFVNAVFQIRGGTGPTLTLNPHASSGSAGMFYVSDDGSADVNLGASPLTVLSGTTASPPAAGQWASGGYGRQIVLFNVSTHAFAAVPASTSLDGTTYANWMKVGHLSSDQDPNTGNYVLHMYHPNSHENSSVHHAPRSHLRRHDHKHKQHRGHFANCVFNTRGGVSTNLALNAINGATPRYVLDDGTPAINLAAGIVLLGTGGGGAPYYGAWPPSGPAGAIVLFDIGSHGFASAPDGTNLEGDAYSSLMKVGHMSTQLDPATGQYIFHMYHPGSHENHSTHGATQHHVRRHKHHHDQSKHHHHNITYKIAGCASSWPYTGTLSWPAGTIIDDSNAVVGSVVAGQAVVSAGQMVFYNSGSGYVEGCPAGAIGGFSARDITSDADIPLHLIGRVSDNPDATTGQLYLEGHHVGSHQHHGKHSANGAIAGTHMSYNYTLPWTNIGFVQLNDPSSGSGWWVFPDTWTLMATSPTFPLPYLHAGQWEVGAGLGAGSPDASTKHTRHYTVGSSGGAIGTQPQSAYIPLSSGQFGLFVNSVTHDLVNNWVQVSSQPYTTLHAGASHTFYVFVRWHAHNPIAL